MGQVADVQADKFVDMCHFKLSLDGTFGGIFEVQVNQEGGYQVASALLHKVQRTALLDKEIFMEQVEKGGIFIVFHGELTSHQPHTREGAGFAFFRDAVSIEELTEFGFQYVFRSERHRVTTSHPFSSRSIFISP